MPPASGVATGRLLTRFLARSRQGTLRTPLLASPLHSLSLSGFSFDRDNTAFASHWEAVQGAKLSYDVRPHRCFVFTRSPRFDRTDHARLSLGRNVDAVYVWRSLSHLRSHSTVAPQSPSVRFDLVRPRVPYRAHGQPAHQLLTVSFLLWTCSMTRVREAARPGPSFKSAVSHTFLRDTRNAPFLATAGSLFKATQVRDFVSSTQSHPLGPLTWSDPFHVFQIASLTGSRWSRRGREAFQVDDRDGHHPSSRSGIRMSMSLSVDVYLSLAASDLTCSPPLFCTVRGLLHPDRSRSPSRPVQGHPPR